MGIPLSQFETWSSQGAIQTSSSTYNSVKSVLEGITEELEDFKISIYLQGSYGNDTNVWKDSDVDIIVELKSYKNAQIFYSNLNDLQKQNMRLSTSTLDVANFRNTYFEKLKQIYSSGNLVLGNKSIKIHSVSSYRDVDVVFTLPYRKYTNDSNNKFIEGVAFTSTKEPGKLVINYPKIHMLNATSLHQSTMFKFKKIVRIFKNLRNKMVEDGEIVKEIAPSYFIECLISNLNTEDFKESYDKVFLKVLALYRNSNKSNMLVLNNQNKLFGDANDQWNEINADLFINHCIQKYINWK